MSARDTIIHAIRAAKPGATTLPVIGLDGVSSFNDPVTEFVRVLEGIGGKGVTENAATALEQRLQEAGTAGHLVFNTRDPAFATFGNISQDTSAAKLEKIWITCLTAEIGVAENGAVWIPESAMQNRLLPFICQHLLIVISKENIVSAMHHAYERISAFGEGFGVFLAGPSKTADIEQSLVIGAHGARSLTVYLIN